MTEDLFGETFTDPSYDPNKDYISELVGPGKKIFDEDERQAFNKLAYSKLEADRFIERLKQERDADRQELNARDRLEELLTKMQSQTNNQSASNVDNQGTSRDSVSAQTTTVGLTPQQVEDLFEAKLRERTNFQQSVEGIKKLFGSDYQPKLDAEAKKLGLTKDFVNNLAKTNPQAFIRLFEPAAKQETDILTPPQSSVNTNSFSPTGGQVRTQKWYKDLKAKDPVKYRSKEIQLQEYQDAIKLGEKFFDLP